VVHAVSIPSQRVAKHRPADANTRNNRRYIARQQRGKQALSTIQAVFRGVRAKRIGSCGRTRMRIEGVQRSTTEYNGVSLRKEDLMCAVVTLRLLQIRWQDTTSED
jgi:hypothetical protein